MIEKERSIIIDRFHKAAQDDSRILAAFLGGSLASGTADAYSDIDIYYVLDPPSYNSFHSQAKSLAWTIMMV